MSLTLKEEVIETYKIQAYSDNILDCFYKVQNGLLVSYFNKTFRACKNFNNRLSAKGNDKPDKLLLDVLTKEQVVDFENYRNVLDKAISFCLSTHPDEISRLEKIIDSSREADMMFIDIKNFRKVLVDLRLSTLSIDEYMKQKGFV